MMMHATASSSAPAVVASSDLLEGDTTLALATPIPYSSDGPTLPIIGGTSGVTSGAAASSGDLDASRSSTCEEGTRKSQRKMNRAADNAAITPPRRRMPRTDLEPLHKPWTLLPLEILRTIRLRLGSAQGWEDRCISVVFTKNQNVKSGINRLKAYLGYQQDSGSSVELPDALRKAELLIAVSAQGEATTKLVGIVDMVRRIVKTTKHEGFGDEGKAETWYLYTSLASRVVRRRTMSGVVEETETVGEQTFNTGNDGGGDVDTRHTGDESGNNRVKRKKIPVLTAWMSKKTIPEFKKAFGEQTFQVQKTNGED
jgi:hypothetical protein